MLEYRFIINQKPGKTKTVTSPKYTEKLEYIKAPAMQVPVKIKKSVPRRVEKTDILIDANGVEYPGRKYHVTEMVNEETDGFEWKIVPSKDFTIIIDNLITGEHQAISGVDAKWLA